MEEKRFEGDPDAKRAVRAAFEEEMFSRYPFFHRWKAADVPKSLTCWSWSGGGVRVFVGLLFAQYDSRFTLECGWTVSGRFPNEWSQYWRSIRKQDGTYDTRPIVEGVRFRTSELEYPSVDRWWNPMGPKRRDRSVEAVREALESFSSLAVPFIAYQTRVALPIQATVENGVSIE